MIRTAITGGRSIPYLPTPSLSRLLLRRLGGGGSRSRRLGGALLGGLLVVLLGSRLRIGSRGGSRLRRGSGRLLGSERQRGDREGEGKQCCFHFFISFAGLALSPAHNLILRESRQKPYRLRRLLRDPNWQVRRLRFI